MQETRDVNALLGTGSEFEGKLTFEGVVRIDGVFKGEIFTADTLIIGEGAQVSARIEAGTVIVHGDVQGNITTSQLIELHAPARLRGNIETPHLVIDRGVLFEGACRMDLEAPAQPQAAAGGRRERERSEAPPTSDGHKSPVH